MRKKRILKITGAAVVLLFAASAIFIVVMANQIISSMTNVHIETDSPGLEHYNLTGEEIRVTSKDGTGIHAYVVPNDQSKGNVLILHGMHGMDAKSLLDYSKFLYESGYTPISVDMRAHGKSEGESLSFGYLEVYDVLAVIDYLKQDSRFKDEPIILYGLSMGGSTAINTAAKSADVDAVIAVSPFSSIQDQVVDYMKQDNAPSALITAFQPAVNLVLWNKFNINPVKESPKRMVRHIPESNPVLIIHGDSDTQTELYQAQELFDACSSTRKELWIVREADHLIVEDITAPASKEYRDRIINFLDTAIISN